MLGTWNGITLVHLKNPRQYLRKLLSKYLSQALTEDLRDSVVIFSAFIWLRTAFSWCSTVICSYIYLKKQFDFTINQFV